MPRSALDQLAGEWGQARMKSSKNASKARQQGRRGSVQASCRGGGQPPQAQQGREARWRRQSAREARAHAVAARTETSARRRARRGPLTPAQFRKKYCASPRDAQKVAKVLKGFGLKIESTTLETRSMRVSGTVAAVEAAFLARLGIYESKRQGRYRDREDDYKVPSGLRGIITAILGLGQRRVVKKRLAAGRSEVAAQAVRACRFRAALPFPAWRRRRPEDRDRGIRGACIFRTMSRPIAGNTGGRCRRSGWFRSMCACATASRSQSCRGQRS